MIWPIWKYQTYLNHWEGGKLIHKMPFEPHFWRAPEYKEVANSWVAPPIATAPVAAPQGVQGFIVALPTGWTRSEDNLFSKTHIATIAAVEAPHSDTALAQNEPAPSQESTV